MPSAPFSADSLPLRDIHLPPAISWWPPAPGWWLLLLGLFLLIVALYAIYQRRQRKQLQQLALFELDELQRQYSEFENPQQLLEGLSCLLRQSAILHFPQNNCAGLVGEGWLSFLDQQLDDQPFSQGPGRLLAEGPYLPRIEQIDTEALLSLCRRWLQQLPPAPKPQGRRK